MIPQEWRELPQDLGGWYNVRVKTYPDGTQNMMYSDHPIETGYELDERPDRGGAESARKKVENRRRALQAVFDYARCNDWDWFITLTFNPQLVDSFDYNACVEGMKDFTKWLQQRYFVYLMVPEPHKSGRYHFHGLVQGQLPVIPARHAHTGELLFDDAGRPLYNIPAYKLGWTTASPVSDSARASSYLSKYLTKDMVLPKYKKCYWASRSLVLPALSRYEATFPEFGKAFVGADYQRAINGPRGIFLMAEDHGGKEASQQRSKQNKNFR